MDENSEHKAPPAIAGPHKYIVCAMSDEGLLEPARAPSEQNLLSCELAAKLLAKDNPGKVFVAVRLGKSFLAHDVMYRKVSVQ